MTDKDMVSIVLLGSMYGLVACAITLWADERIFMAVCASLQVPAIWMARRAVAEGWRE